MKSPSFCTGGEDEAGRHGGCGGVYLEQCGAAVRGDLQGVGREGRVERCPGGWWEKIKMTIYISDYPVIYHNMILVDGIDGELMVS